MPVRKEGVRWLPSEEARKGELKKCYRRSSSGRFP
jgi:hypothetical protein